MRRNGWVAVWVGGGSQWVAMVGRWLGNPWLSEPLVIRENPGKSTEKHGKSWIFIVFSMIFWPNTIPKHSDNPSDHFELVSASPDLSRPKLH